MRLVRFIQTKRVVILIDSGSTHNFIDPSSFTKVPLGEVILLHLQVRVANGDIMSSSRKCNFVTLKVQGTTIITYFYLIPLGGCDVVLSIDWLLTLGPVIWDFSKLTLEYTLAGHHILLQGLFPTGFSMEDGPQFLNGSLSESKEFLLHITSQGLISNSSSPPTPIKDLLTQFQSIF